MLKIIKENTKNGAIDNKVFYEISERLLKIMQKLEITNSFTTKDFGNITAQTEVILTALDTIDFTIDGHISNYIDN